MGTRERVMARMIEAQQGHGGYPGGSSRGGVEVLGRDAWARRAAPMRYTITQVGGRLVIQPLD